MGVSIKDKDIDAVNTAALSNKLLQMASGSIYGKDINMIHILDRKLNALKDLMDGSNRMAYRYYSDLKRIKDKFDVREHKTR